MRLRKRIREIANAGIYRHALFYNFPGGLRFELSEGGSPLDQVLTALHKATAICQDIFGDKDPLLVHLQKFAPSSRVQWRDTVRELRIAGVVVPIDREIWLEKGAEDDADDDEYWINCVFEVSASKLQNLLWCALSFDFASIRPNPHCLVYLAHPEKGIIVHPYDDRGMDIICQKTSALQELYEKHYGWLLRHDIEAMQQTFARQ